MSTPRELADLAESLVPVAARLVGAVHDDGVGDVGRVLAGVDPAHMPALAVVLAAMVDPDLSATDLLAWVTWDDEPRAPRETLFGVASDRAEPQPAAHPEEWTDEECKELAGAYRRRWRGTGDPFGDPLAERRGYLEWERRRKRRTRGDGQRASTRVS